MALKALIFDMDGTLVDTDSHHFEAYHKVFKDLGRELSRAEYDTEMAGTPNLDILRRYFPDKDAQWHLDTQDLKEQTFLSLSPAWEPMPGLRELLAWAEKHDLETALVTSAARFMADDLLKKLGLGSQFSPEVFAAELARGKPDPLPYQTALELLRIAPEEALVFEDAVKGVMSAVAAGIPTIGLSTTQPAAALEAEGATFCIQDFSEAALWQYLEKQLS